MNRASVFVLPILANVLVLPAFAQSLGTAPPLGLNEVDLYSTFHLPPLRDTASGGLDSALSSTQVGIRAALLSLNGTSALDAWSKASAILEPSAPAPCATGTIPFSGTAASQLNPLLASGCVSIVVTSSALAIDQPIEVQHGGTWLDLGRCVLSSSSAFPYMLRVEGAGSVSIRGGEFSSGMAAILVRSSTNVHIQNAWIHNLTSDGIVVTDSANVVLERNRIRGLSGAGILLHHGTTLSAVEYNDIARNLGFSNVDAGIVITDRDVDLAANPNALFGPDGYWEIPEPISSRLNPPHDNAIAFNRLLQNASSGIYADGGVRNTFASNIIAGNSKEGLCLDYGATSNVVTANVVTLNGNRWGEPDSVLAADYIANGGRLPDGTAAEKVPGISLDNAMYNIVFANTVQHNFGGGIKLVRTGYLNLIGMNALFSNNDGASDAFHFFGIELGATPGDNSSPDLDNTPSRGNLVFSNLIRGNHYSGIFFDAGCDLNNIFDNTVLDAQDWALESVAVMANDTLNNLTNLPSRNIGSGIDPALLTIGQPVLDPPH